MKSIKKRYPSYFKNFKCIGGKCSDSCCIGWNIDIDKTTFKKYFKVKDNEMKKMFQRNVMNNERCSSDDVDYGIVKLRKDKRCPFLDKENYCVIHSNLGEEYLSNVCTCFPRVTNKIDEVYEMSLDVSCPEAARLILLNKEKINFINKEENLGKYIISAQINTKVKYDKNTPLRYFKEVRDFCINLVQNRKFTISERLYILGDFINELEDKFESNSTEILSFIQEYDIERASNDYNMDDINTLLGNGSMNQIIKMNFFIKMIKILNVDKEVESYYFKRYTEEILNGYGIEEIKSILDKDISSIKIIEQYQEILEEKYNYIFENYLVNFIYNYTFPFNEILSPFDSFIMLLVRTNFIKFYLIGLYLNNNEINDEKIVEFIQVFSKTIEHHKDYLINSLQYIKRNEYNNLEFAKNLL